MGAGIRRAGVPTAFAVVLLAALLVAARPAGAVSVGIVRTIAADYLGKVTCNPAGACFATGSDNGLNGGLYPITDLHTGATGTPVFVPGMAGINGVACPTASTCVVVGTRDRYHPLGEVAAVTNGVAGPVHEVPATLPDGQMSGVACPTPAICLATGYSISSPGESDFVLPIADIASGTPGVPYVVPTGTFIPGITCPTPSTCLAFGSVSDPSSILDAAVTPITNLATGATGPPQVSHLDGKEAFFSDLACPTATSCIAVGYHDAGRRWDGITAPITDVTTGALGLARVNPDGPLGSITCAEQKCAVFADLNGSTGATNGAVAAVVDNSSGAVGRLQSLGDLRPGGAACLDHLTCVVVGVGYPAGGGQFAFTLPFDMRLPTGLFADAAILGVSSQGAATDVKVSLLVLHTRLVSDGVGLANKPLTFSAGGSTLCDATSGPDGTASCTVLLDPARASAVLQSGGYTVTFKGDADYGPSHATGPVIRV